MSSFGYSLSLLICRGDPTSVFQGRGISTTEQASISGSFSIGTSRYISIHKQLEDYLKQMILRACGLAVKEIPPSTSQLSFLFSSSSLVLASSKHVPRPQHLLPSADDIIPLVFFPSYCHLLFSVSCIFEAGSWKQTSLMRDIVFLFGKEKKEVVG